MEVGGVVFLRLLRFLTNEGEKEKVLSPPVR